MSLNNLQEINKNQLLLSSEPILNKIKAIGHPFRFQILIFLSNRIATFNEILDEINKPERKLGSTALAHHLSSLESEGLIEKVKRGEYKNTSYSEQILAFLSANNDNRVNIILPISKPEEKIVSGNPVYQPGWNSFVSSLSGILNSLNVNYDYIEVGGRTGVSFAITMDNKSAGFKAIDAFTKETFNSILDMVESFGFKVNMWEQEKTFANTFQMNDDDFNKVKNIFDEIKNVICCNDNAVMLYGLRSYIYGIVKGYSKDSYIVSTFYRSEGRIDTPVRFDSIYVDDVFRFIYLTRHDTIAINSTPDYKEIIKFALKMMKGEGIVKEGFVAGPSTFDEWINKLKDGKNAHISYFGRHYNDARVITTEYLERIARICKGKSQAEWIMNASKEHRKVKSHLEDFMMLFPYFEPEKILFTDEIIEEGIKTLLNAKSHEIKAIQYIEKSIEVWE